MNIFKVIAQAASVLAAFSLSMAATAAVIWQVDGAGTLTGANGVIVGGISYDVSFVDGSCGGLFNGCDSPEDFIFSTKARAAEASQSLLDQVFIGDGPGGYDDHPELTRGCGDLRQCYVWTPFARQAVDGYVLLGEARNCAAGYCDDDWTSYSYTAPGDTNTGPFGQVTYAVWTASTVPETSPVPEPSVLALLAAGLFCIGVAHRRRGRSAPRPSLTQ